MEKWDSGKSCILIDWLTFTVHGFSFDELVSLMGLDLQWDDEFKTVKFYPRMKTSQHIRIHYGADDPMNYAGDLSKCKKGMGMCVDLSGQACRAFESFSRISWDQLFDRLLHLPEGQRVNFTRIDLAYDDFDGILDVGEIAMDTLARHFTARAKLCDVHFSDNQMTDVFGTTVYIGRSGSDFRIRIYDKLAERIAKDQFINSIEAADLVRAEIQHWVRCELVIRNANVLPVIQLLVDGPPIGQVFGGLLKNYCVFRVLAPDANKSRWPVAPYWQHLIEGCERIRIYSTPGLEYDMLRSVGYMVRTWGQMMRVLDMTNLYGGVAGVIQASKQLKPNLNDKYLKIIRDFHAWQAMQPVQDHKALADQMAEAARIEEARIDALLERGLFDQI